MATSKEEQALLTAVKEMASSNERLGGEVAALGRGVQNVTSYSQKSRRYIRLLVFSVVFDVVLSLLLGFIGLTARNAAIEAKAATTASRIAQNNLTVICEATNASNAKQRALWEPFLVNPQIPPNETPAAKTRREEQTRKFQDTLNTTFAQQDCKGGRP